jgi:hypothetical protein
MLCVWCCVYGAVCMLLYACCCMMLLYVAVCCCMLLYVAVLYLYVCLYVSCPAASKNGTYSPLALLALFHRRTSRPPQYAQPRMGAAVA